MSLIAHFERMFDHAHWANRRVAQTLQGLEGKTEKPYRWFAHILGAEKVWLTRLNGRSSKHLPIWPKLSLEQCETLLAENQEGYRRFLSALTDVELAKPAENRNQTGAASQTSIQDILTHVCMHGNYHRGQIAASLREEGFEPVGTDYFLYIRQLG